MLDGSKVKIPTLLSVFSRRDAGSAYIEYTKTPTRHSRYSNTQAGRVGAISVDIHNWPNMSDRQTLKY
jgi:hypothetical protein